MKFEYEKHSNAPVNTEDVLTDLKRVAKEEEKVSQSIYSKKGRYVCRTIIRRFGTWNKALKKAKIVLSVEYANSQDKEVAIFPEEKGIVRRTGRDPSLRLRFKVMKEIIFLVGPVELAQPKIPLLFCMLTMSKPGQMAEKRF